MSQHLTALLQQSYDELPHVSHQFPQSAPGHLEAVAMLFGLAPTPPAAARVLELGITNLDLRQMNLEDVDASLGSFDYILCHGVYSWVPDSVRQAIWRTCSAQLAPGGIAYVSYNTYPGWKAREIVRDAMLFRAQAQAAPADRIACARGLLA